MKITRKISGTDIIIIVINNNFVSRENSARLSFWCFIEEIMIIMSSSIRLSIDPKHDQTFIKNQFKHCKLYIRVHTRIGILAVHTSMHTAFLINKHRKKNTISVSDI